MNRLFITMLISIASISAFSQPKQGGDAHKMSQNGGISLPASLDGMMQENKFIVDINPMTKKKKRHLDRKA